MIQSSNLEAVHSPARPATSHYATSHYATSHSAAKAEPTISIYGLPTAVVISPETIN